MSYSIMMSDHYAGEGRWCLWRMNLAPDEARSQVAALLLANPERRWKMVQQS